MEIISPLPPRGLPSCAELLETVEIKGKGRGLVAARDLKAGACLLSEAPLVCNWEQRVMLVCNVLESGSRFKDLSFLKHDTVSSPLEEFSDEEWSTACAKIRANVFMLQDQDRLALYAHISMLNHSCCPNATLYRPDHVPVGEHVESRLHAMADIRKGEEITICYRNDLLLLPTKARQQLLQRLWQFSCVCVRCLGNVSEHDTKLQAYSDSFVCSGLDFGIIGSSSSDWVASFEQLFSALHSSSRPPPSETGKAKAEKFALLLKLYNSSENFFGLSHWRVILLRKELIRVQVEKGSFAEVIPHVVLQLATEQQILPKYHHSRLRMARLLVHCVRTISGGKAKGKGALSGAWVPPFSSSIGQSVMDLDVNSVVHWDEFDELQARYG